MTRRIRSLTLRSATFVFASVLAACGAGASGVSGESDGDGGSRSTSNEASGSGGFGGTGTATTGGNGNGGAMSSTGTGTPTSTGTSTSASNSATGSGGASTATGSSSAATTTATSSTGGVGGGAASTTVGSSSSGIEVCAAESTTAQQIPLDMYIMLDQSSSMSDGKTPSRWTSVTTALAAFVDQPDAAGIGVGIQYFGLPPGGGSCPSGCSNANTKAQCSACGGICIFNICTGGVGGDSCNAADYAKPEVEIAPLPGVAQAIKTSMSQHKPSTATPTSAALQGAIDHAKAWGIAHPNHTVIAVFATDGEPSGCDNNMNNIKAIAAAGFNGTPSVLTYVVGVGNATGNLNDIASSGGTGKALLVQGNPDDVNQQFLDAMNAIRGAALGCTYLIPTPGEGTVDYGKVNVEYTPGGGNGADLFGKVNGEANCPPNGDGWYYNDEQNPSAILLCPSTCTTVSADPAGKVDIAIGCQTRHQ